MKKFNIIILVIFISFKLYGQKGGKRIVIECTNGIFSTEVFFDSNRSATVTKNLNGEVYSVSICDKLKREVIDISYKEGVPHSFQSLDFNQPDFELRQIELESESVEYIKRNKIGLDTFDSKYILGFKCYKVNLKFQQYYSTFEIPNHSDIATGLKKSLGGLPLQIISESPDESCQATKIDDNFNDSYFKIDLSKLINKNIKIEEEQTAEGNQKVIERAKVIEIQEFGTNLNENENEKYYLNGKYKFENSGITLNVPSKYSEHFFDDLIHFNNTWYYSLKEIESKNYSFNFLEVDTLNILYRFKKIISFINPHLQSENTQLYEGNNYQFVSAKEFKISDFRGITFAIKSKDRLINYFLIKTPKTYIVSRLEVKDSYKYDLDEWISGLQYNGSQLLNYLEDLTFQLDVPSNFISQKSGNISIIEKIDKSIFITLKNIPLNDNTLVKILNEEKDNFSLQVLNVESDKSPVNDLESFRRKITCKYDGEDVIYYQQAIKTSENMSAYMEALIYANHKNSYEEVKKIFDTFKLKQK